LDTQKNTRVFGWGKRETAPPINGHSSTASAPRGATRRIRRIVVGSLLTGWVMVGILTLVVFAGAREHVITGSALLGFSFGWAMLAVLSTRMTDQPQRWAVVPAAGMGAAGLGLLILSPDDRALTAAGWVWPPLLLALAVWMGFRVRRSLAARSGRWALYLVVGLTVVAAIGGTFETLALTSDRSRYTMPGQSYDVGGHQLHLDCTGSGSPTVVLQSGLGEFSPHWTHVVRAINPTTRVCAYDRAGQGWSDDLPYVQDGIEAAADLHRLLTRAGEKGPFVLAGHSTGGTYAMTFAARYPEEVAGMVLLDSTDPYQASPMFGSPNAPAPAAFAILPSIARMGIGQVFPSSFWSTLPEPAAGQIQAFVTSPRRWRNYRDEIAAIPALLNQAQALTTFGSKPLIVLTADAAQERPAAHDLMAELSTNSSHRFTDETHSGLLDQQSGAAVSADAIGEVVQAVRIGSELPQL
jgi:pimeloyl-ACP methyl ester carboxylesterase